jgi:hypothetical protein
MTWLVDEGISQSEVQTRIAETFGIKVGKTAVSEFYRDECLPIRYQRSARSADTLRALMESVPGAFDEATTRALTQRVFELSSDPESSYDELTALAGVLGEARKLALKEQELALRTREAALKEEQGAERLRIQAQEFKLKFDKFRFDAARAAMRHAAELGAIMRDSALDDDSRLKRVQMLLWGDTPDTFAPTFTHGGKPAGKEAANG